MAKLIIYEEIPSEEIVFEDFELLTNRILIGSSPDNQLVLDAPNIDPAHASLELRQDHWVIQDLGAPGGTFVNNIEIAGPFTLQSGDLIEVGSIKLRFQDLEVAATTEPDLYQLETDETPDLPLRGRVWFAKVASGTAAIILLIGMLLVTAHLLGLMNISDLLPHWLPGN